MRLSTLPGGQQSFDWSDSCALSTAGAHPPTVLFALGAVGLRVVAGKVTFVQADQVLCLRDGIAHFRLRQVEHTQLLVHLRDGLDAPKRFTMRSCVLGQAAQLRKRIGKVVAVRIDEISHDRPVLLFREEQKVRPNDLVLIPVPLGDAQR